MDLLKQFNLTETEAKVYLALYNNKPCTGYEAANLAGVPRSKVYGALESLSRRGLLLISQGEKTKLYCTENKEHLLQLLSSEKQASLNALDRALDRHVNNFQGQYIWSFTSYQLLLTKAYEYVEQAQEEVLLQIWLDDLSKNLETLLLQKQAAGLRVLVVLYDAKQAYTTAIKHFYAHGFEAEKLRELGARWLNLTVDGKQMLYASIKEDGCDAISTANESMVFFAKEYIMHDAYCLRLIKHLQNNVKDAFGADMQGLRNVFEY